jgi:phosphoesterase RecJ-like protein
LVENAIFVKEGRAVICPLTMETVKTMGLTEEDMSGISAFPRTIAGVKFAVLLRQMSNDHIGVSARALPGYNAGVFCEKFGGGGHKGAGGGGFTGTMEAAIAAVMAALPEEL